MADLLAWNVNRAVDTNGDPAAGAKAYFYTPGTSSPKTVYSDAALTIPHSVPLVADAEGVFAQVYTSGAVKVLVTDSADVTLTGYPMDPAYFIPASGSGADRITFAPTVDIPQDNVQDAIEQVQANLTAPLADLGLGVTGSADQLADIDATGIASGFYRYGTGTSGTYPSGVTAAAGGIVLIWRETAAEAHMLLMPRGATMGYRRTMTSTAWGSWVVEPAVLDEDDMASDSATRPPSQQSVKAYVDGVTVGPTSASAATSVDFTSIPSDVSMIEVVIESLSLSGTDNIYIQLSTSSTFVTTGYECANTAFSSTSAGTATYSTAFVVGMGSATRVADGILTLTRVSGTNRWAAIGSHKRGTNEGSLTSGLIDLAGALDGVRVRSSGTDTFDSGSVAIRYVRG